MSNHIRVLALLCNLLLAAILLLLPNITLAAGYGNAITLESAKKAVAGAADEARRNGFAMAIAIVDSSGNLVYFEKMDDTQIASIEVALGKARSANNFKRPTKALEDAVNGGRNSILGMPGAVPIEGGIPLTENGKILGAIGVSGGTSQQDGAVASAGVKALETSRPETPR
jgi:glc operon protein GlcG